MFPFKNSSKDAKCGQCSHLWVPFVVSGTDVKKGLKPIFNVVILTKSAVSRLVRMYSAKSGFGSELKFSRFAFWRQFKTLYYFILLKLYLFTLTPSTIADFQGGRDNVKKKTICIIHASEDGELDRSFNHMN